MKLALPDTGPTWGRALVSCAEPATSTTQGLYTPSEAVIALFKTEWVYPERFHPPRARPRRAL